MAVACGDEDTLIVFRGTAAGGWQTPLTVVTANQPSAVVIADVTGDGRPDLAWTTFQVPALHVLPGTATPFDPLRTPASVPVGLGPVAIRVADVNRDGRPDVVTANSVGNTASVLLGGSGGLIPASPVSVGSEPAALTLADFDGDAIPDLAVGHSRDTLRVFRGVGDGTFDTGRELFVGANQTAVAVADFDADGRSDLLVANGPPDSPGDDPDTLRLAFGNGDGTFRSAGAFLVGREPSSIVLADLNGDGVPDAVTADKSSDAISVSLGDGDGTFGTRKTFAVGRRPVSVTLADFNGDGRLDAATANRLDNSLSVMLGNGDGTFLSRGSYPVGIGPQAVVAADLDGDGRSDLVSADEKSDTLTVWWGTGDGTFATPTTIPVGNGPIALAVSDLDGDGRPDLVTADRSANALSIVFATGTPRTYRDARTLPTEPNPVAVAVGDLDGDGRPDLVVGHLGNTHAIFRGTGGQSFARVGGAIPGGSYGLVITDWNGDGKPDLASTDITAGTVGISPGNGDGTFGNPTRYPVGQSPIFLATADLNADGRPDLVSANTAESTIGVRLGSAPGTEPESVSPLRDFSADFTPLLVDLNGDGLTDAVSRDRTGAILFRAGQASLREPFAAPTPVNDPATDPALNVVVLELGGGRRALAAVDRNPDLTALGVPRYRVSGYNLGPDGRFTRESLLTTPYRPTGLLAADLDASGRSSLVLTYALDDRVTIAPAGRFDSPVIRSVGDNPTTVILADPDGDGRPDLLVGSSVAGDATMIRNMSDGSFPAEARYRTGTDLAGVTPAGTVSSLRQPAALASGRFFTGDSRDDLVILQQGSHGLATLRNNGRGGFLNPAAEDFTSTTNRRRAPQEEPVARGPGRRPHLRGHAHEPRRRGRGAGRPRAAGPGVPDEDHAGHCGPEVLGEGKDPLPDRRLLRPQGDPAIPRPRVRGGEANPQPLGLPHRQAPLRPPRRRRFPRAWRSRRDGRHRLGGFRLMAKPLSALPPSSSVAKLLEPGIGAAAIRTFVPAPTGTPAGGEAGVRIPLQAPDPGPQAVPTGEAADVKREFTLTRSSDATLDELVAIYQRTTGCKLHASHVMRAVLRALGEALPEIEREAIALGPLRRPSNATGKESERDAFEARIAASLRAGMRGRRDAQG